MKTLTNGENIRENPVKLLEKENSPTHFSVLLEKEMPQIYFVSATQLYCKSLTFSKVSLALGFIQAPKL